MHSSRDLHDLPFRWIGAVLLATAACALLGACASVRPGAHAHAATTPAAVPVAQSDDVLLKMLSAQFALQDGDLASGAAKFADAAQLSSDPMLAEEATRLALSIKDWVLARRGLARWQQLAPEDSGVVQARAWIALGEKRGDDAYADLDALAARGDDQGWRQIAQTLLGTDDKEVSARVLARLATPEHLSTQETNWVAVSQLAYKLGDKTLAQRLADAAVTRFHGDDGYAWSARLALDRGDKSAARAIYADALKRDPKSLRLRGGYAALLADSGDNAGAARALAAVRRTTSPMPRAPPTPRVPTTSPRSNALYRELGGDKAARSGKRLYLLGQLAELLDNGNAALGWYREIHDDDEHWFDAQMREAVVLDKLGRTDRRSTSCTSCRRSRATTPNSSATCICSKRICSRAGSVRATRSRSTRGPRTLPDDTRLLYARALLAVDQGDRRPARSDLRRVIELKPDDADAMNALGYTLADPHRRSQQPEALDLIQRALKLKPDEPAIIDSMGWVHYRMGDLDAALTRCAGRMRSSPMPRSPRIWARCCGSRATTTRRARIWEEGRKKDAKNKTLLETIKRLTT